MYTEYKEQDLLKVIEILKILSHKARLGALCIMLEKEISVNELSGILNVEQTALSQHLKILKDMGLVSVRRDHRTLYYSTKDPKLLKLINTLQELYCA
jgi:DNA-binding transcriptional ArsR family regulator